MSGADRRAELSYNNVGDGPVLASVSKSESFPQRKSAAPIGFIGERKAPRRGAKYGTDGWAGRLPKRHIFVRGMLRCGECGEAMLPRSYKHARDTDVCRGRGQ